MPDQRPQAAPPSADLLLTVLEQAVEEVFSTMIGNFEAAAVYHHSVPAEQVDTEGEIDLLIDRPDLPRVHIDRAAVVEVRGAFDGRVILRCSADGALDIAQGLLMLSGDEMLAVEEVNDALKECANMVTGSLKSKALDPHGNFVMSIPFLQDASREPFGATLGTLVYKLQKGAISVEIWLRRESATEVA